MIITRSHPFFIFYLRDFGRSSARFNYSGYGISYLLSLILYVCNYYIMAPTKREPFLTTGGGLGKLSLSLRSILLAVTSVFETGNF